MLGDLANPIKLDLSSVLPQTPLMNDFVDRQMSAYRGIDRKFEKTLSQMGDTLGISSNIKNNILTEHLEEFELDDDIINDSDKKKDNDDE